MKSKVIVSLGIVALLTLSFTFSGNKKDKTNKDSNKVSKIEKANSTPGGFASENF
jgi:hypothetical protein